MALQGRLRSLLDHEGPVASDSGALSGEGAWGKPEGSVHYVSLRVQPGVLIAGEYRLTLTPAVAADTAEPVERIFALR